MERHPDYKLFAAFMLGVFAFFVCGNTLCLHSHNIGDSTIVHSHPYLPSYNHTHSQQSLNTIAAFNTTPVPNETSAPELMVPMFCLVVRLTSNVSTFIFQLYLSELNPLRAPPTSCM